MLATACPLAQDRFPFLEFYFDKARSKKAYDLGMAGSIAKVSEQNRQGFWPRIARLMHALRRAFRNTSSVESAEKGRRRGRGVQSTCTLAMSMFTCYVWECPGHDIARLSAPMHRARL